MSLFTCVFSEDRNNDPDVIIKELEKRLRNSEDRVKRRDKAMKISQKKIDSIQMEKDEMQAKVKDLEQLLYPKGRLHVHNITHVGNITL